jgi:hypothetical protein
MFYLKIKHIFNIEIFVYLKKKKNLEDSLKNAYDFSNSAKNSPNLSVSEWITNNSLNEKHNEEKVSQCEIFFDGKTLNTLTVRENKFLKSFTK